MGKIYDHNKTHGKEGPLAQRFPQVVEDRVARGLPGIPEGDDSSFREELTAALGKTPRPAQLRPSPPLVKDRIARELPGIAEDGAPSFLAGPVAALGPLRPSPFQSMLSRRPSCVPRALGDRSTASPADPIGHGTAGERRLPARGHRRADGISGWRACATARRGGSHVAALMRWIDEQCATREISDATIRRNLNLLSRFFGWAVERGYTTTN